jgi:hypothetical protein
MDFNTFSTQGFSEEADADLGSAHDSWREEV